jgi:hypothetical protein
MKSLFLSMSVLLIVSGVAYAEMPGGRMGEGYDFMVPGDPDNLAKMTSRIAKMSQRLASVLRGRPGSAIAERDAADVMNEMSEELKELAEIAEKGSAIASPADFQRLDLKMRDTERRLEMLDFRR